MRAPADLLELIQRRTPACEAVAEMLPSLADADGRAKRRVRAHVEHCLRCQAEVAGYRRMLRVVRTLRTDARPPAPGTLAVLLAALDSESESESEDADPADTDSEESFLTARVLLVGGGLVAAAVAVGATGALLWLHRTRVMT
jgi:hypothetical protein